MEDFNQRVIKLLEDINSKLDRLSFSKENHDKNLPIKTDQNEKLSHHIDEYNKIRFLYEIDGGKIPEKQLNAALIYLTLNYKYNGLDEQSSVELGEFLKKHGISTKNLSRSLKKHRNLIMQKGTTGKAVSYMITTPGLIKGEQLLKSYYERI